MCVRPFLLLQLTRNVCACAAATSRKRTTQIRAVEDVLTSRCIVAPFWLAEAVGRCLQKHHCRRKGGLSRNHTDCRLSCSTCVQQNTDRTRIVVGGEEVDCALALQVFRDDQLRSGSHVEFCARRKCSIALPKRIDTLA